MNVDAVIKRFQEMLRRSNRIVVKTPYSYTQLDDTPELRKELEDLFAGLPDVYTGHSDPETITTSCLLRRYKNDPGTVIAYSCNARDGILLNMHSMHGARAYFRRR